jgi:hypothetical protein
VRLSELRGRIAAANPRPLRSTRRPARRLRDWPRSGSGSGPLPPSLGTVMGPRHDTRAVRWLRPGERRPVCAAGLGMGPHRHNLATVLATRLDADGSRIVSNWGQEAGRSIELLASVSASGPVLPSSAHPRHRVPSALDGSVTVHTRQQRHGPPSPVEPREKTYVKCRSVRSRGSRDSLLCSGFRHACSLLKTAWAEHSPLLRSQSFGTHRAHLDLKKAQRHKGCSVL